jgi:hypothetical protein
MHHIPCGFFHGHLMAALTRAIPSSLAIHIFRDFNFVLEVQDDGPNKQLSIHSRVCLLAISTSCLHCSISSSSSSSSHRTTSIDTTSNQSICQPLRPFIRSPPINLPTPTFTCRPRKHRKHEAYLRPRPLGPGPERSHESTA